MSNQRFSLCVSLSAVVLALAGCAQPGIKADATASNAGASAAATAATIQVQRQAVGQGLYEIAYSQHQHAVFVTAAGGRGEGAQPPKVLRLHPETLAVQAEIALDRKGFGMTLDDAGDRLYVGNTMDASVTVIDTAANRVLGVVQLAQKASVAGPDGKVQERYPHNFRELVLDRENHRLYAPGLWFQDSALYVVDTKRLALEKVIPGFGFVATGVALDAQRHALYVSNLQGQLYTVDTRNLAVRGKSEVQADQLLNLVVDQKHGRVLATDQGMERLDGMRKNVGGLDYQNRGGGNRIVAIDPADGRVTHSVESGKGPVSLLLDAPRGRLYVTNRLSGTLTVHEAGSYALLHTVQLPAHPNSLALDPKTGAVYVTVKNGSGDAEGANESVARVVF